MRFEERRWPDLLRRARDYRVVLLHGDDPLLVAERAGRVAEAVGGAGNGLFGVAEIDGPDHARVPAELDSPVLGGGGRLVRLRNATDAACGTVEAVLDAPVRGVVLIEAGPLTGKSRLRSLVERSPAGAAVACWAAEAHDLGSTIDARLARHGVTIEAEARALLMARAEGYGGAVHDAEKAALLVDEHGVIQVADIVALDQAGAAAALDDLGDAASGGRAAETDRLVEGLLRDGVAPMVVIRALLSHFARLRSASLALGRGMSPEQAVAALRPPPFFRRAADMRRAVVAWRPRDLERVCRALWLADRACRQTGAPALALGRRAALSACRAVGPRGGPIS